MRLKPGFSGKVFFLSLLKPTVIKTGNSITLRPAWLCNMLKYSSIDTESSENIIYSLVQNNFFRKEADLNIWFSFPIMLLAGIICGVCIACSLIMLFEPGEIKSWVKYNLIFIVMFILLALISKIVFEPVTTVQSLMSNNVHPDELISQALPLSVIFTISAVLVISIFYGKNWKDYPTIFLTFCILDW